jgi:hypothetical protein
MNKKQLEKVSSMSEPRACFSSFAQHLHPCVIECIRVCIEQHRSVAFRWHSSRCATCPPRARQRRQRQQSRLLACRGRVTTAPTRKTSTKNETKKRKSAGTHRPGRRRFAVGSKHALPMRGRTRKTACMTRKRRHHRRFQLNKRRLTSRHSPTRACLALQTIGSTQQPRRRCTTRTALMMKRQKHHPHQQRRKDCRHRQATKVVKTPTPPTATASGPLPKARARPTEKQNGANGKQTMTSRLGPTQEPACVGRPTLLLLRSRSATRTPRLPVGLPQRIATRKK